MLKENPNLNELLFCPSGRCLYSPEISYLYNPVNPEFQYKCKCLNNYKQPISIKLDEFLQKSSSLICQNCRRKIVEPNFAYCLNCKNIFDNFCIKNHSDTMKHFNFLLINKNNIYNFCFQHKNLNIFYCSECKESLCGKCDINFHGEHTLEQIKKYIINQKEFDDIKSAFEKQKNIFKKIKIIINDLINTLENDIKIKQIIINNYLKYKNDYNSIINLKSLHINNNEKYENILQEFLDPNKVQEELTKINSKKEKFIEKILLPFYYSMMINKDETLNEEFINIMKNKINNSVNNKNIVGESLLLKDQPTKKAINKLSSLNDNSNNLNTPLYPNNFDIKNSDNKQNINNQNNSDIKNFENNLLEKIISLNQSLSLILNNKNINLLSQDNNIMKSSILDNYKKSKKEESEIMKKNKEKSKIEENTDKNKKVKTEQNSSFVNNMILLKSGNFAVSIKRRVEIHDLKKLDTSEKNKVLNNEEIKKNNCRLQNIYPYDDPNGKFISYIFEFPEGNLLCSLFSQIIRIKLTNGDRNHIKIGRIILDNNELTRKMISLGNSLLVILSKKNKDCFIRIYNKINDSQILVKDNINLIDSIIANNLLENNEVNKLNNNNKNNNNDSNINNNISMNNIKEDKTFEVIEKNINDLKISWVSIFEIKKGLKDKIQNNRGINDVNYTFEFVASSNADYESGLGKNIIIFNRLRKESGKYYIKNVGEINGISCSVEANSICQLNEQYLCVGLQKNKNSELTNGFALIDINKREKCKIIEGDNITSIYYDIENSLLIAGIKTLVEKNIYYLTKIYKVIFNKRDETNIEIDMEQKYGGLVNNQNSMIISILKIMVDSNKNYIFATYTKDYELEVVKKELDKFQK